MAFAVPNHLPRHAFSGKEQALGSTSKLYDPMINRIAETPFEELNSSRASSWVAELTKDIDHTKASIHARVYQNLPDFDRQLKSSRNIIERVQNLRDETNGLTDLIHGEPSGLIPQITLRLREHSGLNQRAKDAELLHQATEHAFRCRNALQQLSAIVSEARLAESTSVSQELERMIQEAPEPLPRAHIFKEIQHRFRVLHDTVQERLNDAYLSAVVFISPKGEECLNVSEFVTVPSSSRRISLRDIFAAMTDDSTKRFTSSSKKILLSRFLEPVVWSKASVTVDGHSLVVRSERIAGGPIGPLTEIISFVRTHLTNHLPPTHSSLFAKDLHSSLLSTLLGRLKHSIPSSLPELRPYITLVNASVDFEKDLIPDSIVRPIGEWSLSLSRHYEKKRREKILDHARAIVLDESRLGGVKVEQALPLVAQAASQAFTTEKLQTNGTSSLQSSLPASAIPETKLQAPSPPPFSPVQPAGEEDGWGFDEDEGFGDNDTSEDRTINVTSHPLISSTVNGHINGNGNAHEAHVEPDGDPWGEEDPWGNDDDTLGETPLTSPPSSIISPVPSVVKSARGLEKFSSKSKGASPSIAAAEPLSASSSMSASMSSLGRTGNGTGSVNRTLSPEPRLSSSPSRVEPLAPKTVTPAKETFIVSDCAMVMLKLVQDTLDEARQLAQSEVFDDHPPSSHASASSSSSSSPRLVGDILAATTASVLDLFRALTPVIQAEMMELSPALRMRFSNDATYLASEVERIAEVHSKLVSRTELSTKLKEAGAQLAIVARQRSDIELERTKNEVLTLLRKANGFFDTGNDDQYTVDEHIVDTVVDVFMTLAPDWKSVLAPSAYLDAFSYLMEETLLSVLRDILALPDIPEVDSHRLNALCKKLERLKELFVLVPDEDSQVGAHVPSWFKFAYMAELLEASLADITYLFESGALVDFEREELVRLVQGLFSDTPLRTKTIEKIRTLGLDVAGI